MKKKVNRITTNKSESTIKKNMRELRKVIDSGSDPLASRIAYAMECGIRWVIEETSGWDSLADEAKRNAEIYREDKS